MIPNFVKDLTVYGTLLYIGTNSMSHKLRAPFIAHAATLAYNAQQIFNNKYINTSKKFLLAQLYM